MSSQVKKEKQTLVDFPCLFNIKAILKNEHNAIDIISKAIQQIASIEAESIRQRLSRSEKYISVTIPTHLHNEPQMLKIYRRLQSNPLVLMTL